MAYRNTLALPMGDSQRDVAAQDTPPLACSTVQATNDTAHRRAHRYDNVSDEVLDLVQAGQTVRIKIIISRQHDEAALLTMAWHGNGTHVLLQLPAAPVHGRRKRGGAKAKRARERKHRSASGVTQCNTPGRSIPREFFVSTHETRAAAKGLALSCPFRPPGQCQCHACHAVMPACT